MIWGMKGGWTATLFRDAPDPYKAELELLAEYDLHATSWRTDELLQMEGGRLEELAGWLEKYDVHIRLGVGWDYFSDDPDVIQRGKDSVVETLEVLPKMMRSIVCATGCPRHIHQFTRDPSHEVQVERLTEGLAFVAAESQKVGLPLAYHNVVRYCSDIAEICKRVPNLGFLFDTGNCYLVGDRPLRAARDAAPHTFALHFRDHYVEPSLTGEYFGLRTRGAVLGSGDVGLREIYDLIVKNAPDPDNIHAEMELVGVEGMGPREGLERSLAFVRSL